MVRRLLPLYVVVFTGFLGYSLMITVFTPLLLSADGDELLSASAGKAERTLVLGVLLALYPLGQFLGSPVLGALSDRLGRKPVLLASLGASTLMYGVIAIALTVNSLPLLLAGVFLAGLGEANIALAQGAITDAAPRDDRGRLFGYVYLSASLAYVAGPLAGGKLAAWFDYATPYWVVMGLVATVGIAVAVTFRDAGRREVRGGYLDAFASLARVVTDPRLRPLYLVNFTLYLALFGFFRAYPMYLVDEFGLGVSGVSEYIAYVSVPIVIANVWLVGALMKRYPPRTMVIGAALSAGVFMALIAVPDSELSLWFTLAPTALSVAICLSACAAMLSLAAGDAEQGRAMGNNQSLQSAGEGLSGFLGGALAASMVKLPLLVFAGTSVLGALVLTWIRPRRDPVPVSPRPAAAEAR
jgi:DHA1 family tetracycline resistance protein-like MFS transporter